MLFKKALRTLTILILTLFALSQKTISHERSKEGLIERICLNNFTAEMAKSGIKAPHGMSEFTCDCFLIKINSGLSIVESIDQCKKSASEKYNL